MFSLHISNWFTTNDPFITVFSTLKGAPEYKAHHWFIFKLFPHIICTGLLGALGKAIQSDRSVTLTLFDTFTLTSKLSCSSFRLSARIPAKLDGWSSPLLNLRCPPQIPEFTLTATWPTCDAGPGPTARTPLGKNTARRATVQRGPSRPKSRQENRGPRWKQVRRGARAAQGLGLFQHAKCHCVYSFLYAFHFIWISFSTHTLDVPGILFCNERIF